jgi:hypothetical protein
MIGHKASLPVAAKKSCDIRPRRPHLYKKEAVTKLKIVRFESQDVALRFMLDHNL